MRKRETIRHQIAAAIRKGGIYATAKAADIPGPVLSQWLAIGQLHRATIAGVAMTLTKGRRYLAARPLVAVTLHQLRPSG